MLKYAKIINDETQEVEVGLGNNEKYYISIGMSEMDVDKAYDGRWYVVGYVPEKPHNVEIMERIDELKSFLINADYWGQKYIDGEYTDEEWEQKKEQRKAWRQEIRDLESQIEPEQDGGLGE